MRSAPERSASVTGGWLREIAEERAAVAMPRNVILTCVGLAAMTLATAQSAAAQSPPLQFQWTASSESEFREALEYFHANRIGMPAISLLANITLTTPVAVDRLRAFAEVLEVLLDLRECCRIDQITQLLLPEQLSQEVAVE